MVTTGASCTEPGCDGAIDELGYCDTCGTMPVPATGSVATGAASASSQDPNAVTGGPSEGDTCAEPGCGGTVDALGYCDTCGTMAGPATVAPAARGPDAAPGTAPTGSASVRTPTGPAATSGRATTFVGGSTRSGGSRRVRRDSTRTQASRRSGVGAGIVQVAPVPEADPAAAVMERAEVAERKRFCGNCGEPVGRGRDGREGRLAGFCPNCRTRFDFVPKLSKGELVGGQYEVVGALAHGGLGWIHLATDTAVSGRWVVLKGLLNAGDDAAMAAAVAERRFLAEVQHPNIVEIYNFVSHEGAGYTVMEFVGGRSLKQVLKARREANDGRIDPLPVTEALAYVHAAIPAFSYLHGRGLVYCDFKPDNLILVGDAVKLIDLGGVRRVDDTQGDIYGTVGFQAPEVPTEGVSIASDLYTIGRTLAVLTLDFRGYTSSYVDRLPPAADHPALRDHDPFLRLLSKTCAPHPDDRFQDADVLRDQVLGVLRIIAAAQSGQPHPGPSNLFAGAPGPDDLLPWLAVDPSDPAAGFLARLPDDPQDALVEVEQALADGQVTETVEVRLRRASDLVEAGRPDQARADLDRVLADDPWEWRAVWVQGYLALTTGRLDDAAAAFERCRSEAPGELAPLYAAARVAAAAGETDRAAELFDLVSTVDPAWVEAAFGLARARLAAGDLDGALTAWARVPAANRARPRADRAVVDALLAAGRFGDALARVERLQLGARERTQLDVDVFERAFVALRDGSLQPDPARGLLGQPGTEEGVRRGLEQALRRLAGMVADRDLRVALVDRANQVRPRTLV